VSDQSHISHDAREKTVLPFSSGWVDDTKKLIVCDNFRVQINANGFSFHVGVGLLEGSENLGFTSASGTDDEDGVTDVEQFFELDNLEAEGVFGLQLEIEDGLLYHSLQLWETLSRNVHGWEQVTDKTEEDGHIVSDDLGNVEISEGSHENLIFGATAIRSLESASDDEDRLDGSETPIVVILLG
jgi:hypothetical protein